jgi:hypothetical protein
MIDHRELGDAVIHGGLHVRLVRVGHLPLGLQLRRLMLERYGELGPLGHPWLGVERRQRVEDAHHFHGIGAAADELLHTHLGTVGEAGIFKRIHARAMLDC